MTTEQQPTRHMAWEGCLNARDLGGYPAADGRATRWGAIIRSDSLFALADTGRAALVSCGVRTIIDLRRPDEIADRPNPFTAPGTHGIAYLNAPFEEVRADPLFPSLTLVAQYCRMLDRFASNVAAIMRSIAQAPTGGVLVHCEGGRDRTGLIAALLLDIAGVSRETIATDYALSAECLRPRDEEWLANGPGERAERERRYAEYRPRAEVMRDALAYLDDRYGGTEAYLLRAGVTPEELPRLRERLVGSAQHEPQRTPL